MDRDGGKWRERQADRKIDRGEHIYVRIQRHRDKKGISRDGQTGRRPEVGGGICDRMPRINNSLYFSPLQCIFPCPDWRQPVSWPWVLHILMPGTDSSRYFLPVHAAYSHARTDESLHSHQWALHIFIPELRTVCIVDDMHCIFPWQMNGILLSLHFPSQGLMTACGLDTVHCVFPMLGLTIFYFLGPYHCIFPCQGSFLYCVLHALCQRLTKFRFLPERGRHKVSLVSEPLWLSMLGGGGGSGNRFNRFTR